MVVAVRRLARLALRPRDREAGNGRCLASQGFSALLDLEGPASKTGVAIIGITPHNFIGTGIAAPDFWLPLSLEPLLHADSNWLRDRENECCRLFAWLAPGVSNEPGKGGDDAPDQSPPDAARSAL